MSRAPWLDTADGAMNRFERDVMARWDAGASIERIAEALGAQRKTVGKIISCYANPDGNSRAHAEMARRGSAALADAIAATGRSYS